MHRTEEKARLEEADKACVWHPFTQMRDYAGSRPLIDAPELKGELDAI